MNDDTRDLAQRIRDALRDVTPGEWRYSDATDTVFAGKLSLPLATIECATDRDGHLIAAAPSLLRDALARIEADAATIAALEAALRLVAKGLDDYWSTLPENASAIGTIRQLIGARDDGE